MSLARYHFSTPQYNMSKNKAFPPHFATNPRCNQGTCRDVTHPFGVTSSVTWKEFPRTCCQVPQKRKPESVGLGKRDVPTTIGGRYPHHNLRSGISRVRDICKTSPNLTARLIDSRFSPSSLVRCTASRLLPRCYSYSPRRLCCYSSATHILQRDKDTFVWQCGSLWLE